jgi:uncharacterized protein (DUF2252 family)
MRAQNSDPARRAAAGKAARRRAPLDSHAEFSPVPHRDPVGLLLGQDESRVPDLVPVRHGRMLVSPFAFLRGAALPMAADLATTPSSGLRAQLCGDAHLSNFGVFGSPERRLVFDINDFDETLPGPFEWDVKRLVASLSVAGRESGFSRKQRRSVAVATGAAYREAMRNFARMPILQVWYARVDVEDTLAHFAAAMPKSALRATEAGIAKARTRDNTQALAKLTAVVDGQRMIVSDPPLIVPIEELPNVDVDATYRQIRWLLSPYSRRLPPDRRGLLQRFTLTRIARKVVGVGSVGTRAWILLMEPDDGLEPLLLQAKQAGESVLAAYAGPSEYANHGERVVTGQRKMQATSDIFLGWQRVRPAEDYYIRQLRDWKYAVDVGRLDPHGLAAYGRLCGWTLARAHARTGDRIAVAAYLGKSERFERALAEFAEAYADQTERDHAALGDAVATGRVSALRGI